MTEYVVAEEYGTRCSTCNWH